jgi:hypothetical protein
MSHNEIVAAALADPELTQQERDNIEFALRFRALPFAERKNYTIPDFRPNRSGMPGLADLLTDGGPGGYNAQSIPDRVDEITAIIAKGNRVWATWQIRGTHLGAMYGVPATGNTIDVLEVGQWQIEDGLVTEAWFFVDELSLVRQLGAWGAINTALEEREG